MPTLERAIIETLKKESKKRIKDSEFYEKYMLLIDMQRRGLLNPEDYTIAPLDTVGRRRYQLKAMR